MLDRAARRQLPARATLLQADALRLPLADESMDIISCAFGIRNFGDLQAGLGEMFRVARPGARVVILDFATPRNRALRWAYQLYCDRFLPQLADLLRPDRVGAYRYLPRSIRTFEPPDALSRRLEKAGFSRVRVWRMGMGGVVLIRAVKPDHVIRGPAEHLPGRAQ